MKFNKKIVIQDFCLSDDNAVFIIAEAGVNHGGDINLAKRLVDIGKDAGVDAVKFQAFKTDELILSNVAKAPYQFQTTNSKESQRDMLKNLEISKANNKELKDYCEKKGIIFLTTPFDEVSLEELDDLDLSAYKISSTDLTNMPFLERVAKKGKPIILSTGMSYLAEVETALSTISKYCKDVVLLQCTANYPISDAEVNLSIIKAFKNYFNILVGFSDHTMGIGAAPYAVAVGAKVIEKHFTVDKKLVGPDHKASLSPDELIEFVKEIRKVEQYMGSAIKVPTMSELKTRMSLQKCIVAADNIRKGEAFSTRNMIAKRTGGKGISPLYYESIIGKIADKNYKKDDIIDI